MKDTIQSLKKQYGPNSPAVAEQLNSIGDELSSSRGDKRTALKFHQEALTILEWNKCNAILYDFVEKGKKYAIDMALTLRKIGNLLMETNNFLGAAEVYKECLDVFLEGLIEGGGGLKRKLLECEYKKDTKSYQAVLERADRKTIGRILCLNPDFRAAVRDIIQLFNEMECVKFVGQNAASSRRRRRMVQRAAMEENLRHAAESLSMSDTPPAESSRNEEAKGRQQVRQFPQSSSSRQLTRSGSVSSKSWSSMASENETWMKCFWEKECGRFSRPRPISRRSVTSEEEDDHYQALASMMLPAEESLVIALKRFPLPYSVVGDNKSLVNQSSRVDPLNQKDIADAKKDSEECTGPPHLAATETLSPQSVTRPVFHDGRAEFGDDGLFRVTSSW